MMKRILFFATLSLLWLGHVAAAVEPNKREYERSLRLVNIAWNACRFLGYLNEEAPSHNLLIKQTEKDFARLFPGEHERFQAKEQAWAGVNDSGLNAAEKIRKLEDPDIQCKNAYFNLKATLQATRDRLGLDITPKHDQ